jgi:hypothetical protein
MDIILKINRGLSYQKMKRDERIIKTILKYLIKEYYNYDMNILNLKYIYLLLFTPLPTTLILKNFLYYGNKTIPSFYKNTIPFTMPIIYNNSIELNISNLYYYEITIIEKPEHLTIGIGSLDITQTKIGKVNSVGYNLLEGELLYNRLSISSILPVCNVGDTIGMGFMYIDIYKYQPLFTLNGKLINTKIEDITIYSTLTPIIDCNDLNKINVNLHNKEYMFNLKNYLNNNITFCTQNFFLDNIDKMNNENEQFIDLILYIIK